MIAAPLFSVPQVAELLNVDQSTVRRLIYRGELRAVRIGKLWRCRPEDVERLMTPRPAPAETPLVAAGAPVVAPESDWGQTPTVPMLKFLKKRDWENASATASR